MFAVAVSRLDTSATCNAQLWGPASFLVGVLGLTALSGGLVSFVGVFVPAGGRVER